MPPLPDLILRLATDAPFRAAVCATPAATLAPLGVPPAQQRLLQRTAIHLAAGQAPPRCYFWWGGAAPRRSRPV